VSSSPHVVPEDLQLRFCSRSPELAEQIRTAILPAGGVAFMKHSASSSPTIAVGFGAPTAESFNETREQPLATYQVCASSLDRVQSLLLSGKRREACHYALDQKMWAHAMIISSSMDKEVWKDVVNEFIRTELGVQMNDPAAPLVPASAVQGSGNGRESMRVLYSLFSGQGTAAGAGCGVNAWNSHPDYSQTSSSRAVAAQEPLKSGRIHAHHPICCSTHANISKLPQANADTCWSVVQVGRDCGKCSVQCQRRWGATRNSDRPRRPPCFEQLGGSSTRLVRIQVQ